MSTAPSKHVAERSIRPPQATAGPLTDEQHISGMELSSCREQDSAPAHDKARKKAGALFLHRLSSTWACMWREYASSSKPTSQCNACAGIGSIKLIKMI